ncbi:MAG: glutamine--fructose-6-phosphate transaminase (isomerizing) [Clostridia bacterium]|nr:glutamine--fructose-6-phosphate transaminase (isomerizing) [Clostridia bacterium]
MCGIFGTITNNNVEKTLIEGLKYIEYRGYDSCGICTLENGNYHIHKTLGEVANLEKELQKQSCFNSTLGIAHTRWATNGIVNLNNTHPHLSQNGSIALVHNGIIENVETINRKLLGHTFISDTDSEIVAHLLENNKLTNLDFIDTFKSISGSYAIAFISNKIPNTIFVAKNRCPLYIAKDKDNNSIYVASDPICFMGKCDHYYTLQDKEYGIVNLNEINIYDENKNPIIKNKTPLDLDEQFLTQKTHSTYMEKEIYEIPDVIDTVNNYSVEKFEKIKQIIKKSNIKKVCLIACGTAYHSCLIGANFLKKYASINADVYIASEYLYDTNIIDNTTLYIFVSQSGETADTLACVKLIKDIGLPTITITNALHSSIANLCDITLYTAAKKECAVASTKTYIAQIAMFYRLSRYIGDKDNVVPKKILNIDFFNHSKELINIINKHKKVFLLGRNNDYYTAMEAAIKLRETCYIPCFAMSLGELKHGTLALIDEGALCIVISTNEDLLEKNIATINEIQSRGGHIVLISNHSVKNTLKPIDYKINLLGATIGEIEAIIPMQLLSNNYSLSLGLNPDKPRNLAKSVTVE